jgi:hypothetical protein
MRLPVSMSAGRTVKNGVEGRGAEAFTEHGKMYCSWDKLRGPTLHVGGANE